MEPACLQPELQPAARSSKNSAAAALTLFAAALCVGCANPGPPKPPSLHLPALVKDLSAERTGDRVLLHWTTPSRTTDDMDVKGAITAQICREIGESSPTPALRAAACAPAQRLAVAPGPSQVADALPPALQSEPPALLTYRIQLLNSAGRSAGNSPAAYAASGTAPSPVDSLCATANERGAILEWRTPAVPESGFSSFVDLKRIDLSTESAAPPAKKDKSAPALLRGSGKSAKSPKTEKESPNELHLRAASTTSASNSYTAGTIDTTAVMGDTYAYSAERVRAVTIGSRQLEIHSAPSAPVTLAMRDTFPPRPPTGLAAISGITPADSGATSPYIDLSWEPNSENDLAGYRVYRQLARPDGSPQGPLARLTPSPLTAPAYRDVAVRPGQGYSYSVTAVDAAGNESAPSAKAFETISPEAGEGQH